MTDVIGISLLVGWDKSCPLQSGCGHPLRAAVAGWAAEGRSGTASLWSTLPHVSPLSFHTFFFAAREVRHSVYWFVTKEDGLFFSYLLSHQTEDGRRERDGPQRPPHH